MKLAIGMSILFNHKLFGIMHSPYDARMMTVEIFPDRGVPRLKTFHNHIEADDTDVCPGTPPHAGLASLKKGAAENLNRRIRRWYPKGTDFNRLTRREILQLKDRISQFTGNRRKEKTHMLTTHV